MSALPSAAPGPAGDVSRARRLFAEVQEHKHKSAFHRRQAKRKLIEFKQFKAQLESMGIEVIIEPAHNPDHLSQWRTSDAPGQNGP